MKKILIIGPSPEGTKGGMASVILNQLSSQPENYGYTYEFLKAHEEGNFLVKSKVAIQSLINLWNKKEISLAHIHMASGASFYRKSLLAMICKIKGIPFLFHIHAGDFETFFTSSTLFSQRWMRKILCSAKKIIVLSNHWKILLNTIGINNNVEVLHNGVDTKIFTSLSENSDSISNFLFIGRLGQGKGVYDLLKAIQTLNEMDKLNHLNFFFIGDGEIEEAQRVVIQNDLQRHVHILGWKEGASKLQYFKNCSTVILPSYHEGLPMALVEAMACGKMIISTRVGGIPDLVEQNINGYLIDPGDIPNLVNSILKVINNKDEVEKIKHNNVQKIKESYNLDLLNKKLFFIYHEIIHTNTSKLISNPSGTPALNRTTT